LASREFAVNVRFGLFCSLVSLGMMVPVPGSVLAQEAKYTAILERFTAENGIAGGTLHVSGPDGEIEVSTGVADVNSGQPVTARTRFYIASTGKIMVAAAILAGVEQGELDLDASVWPLVSQLPEVGSLPDIEVVTLRQLLNHTSGLPDYLSEEFEEAVSRDPGRRWSEADVLAFAYDVPSHGAPGSVFEYSNTNYVLLGHILKHSYPDLRTALGHRVLAKAGMQSTSVGATQDDADLARGYAGVSTRSDFSQQAWARTTGDGPLVSTTGDVARFMRALLRDHKLIGAGLLAEMLTGSDQDEEYGLGIGIDGDEWGDWYGHAGSDEGFEADVRYYPDTDVVIAFAFNGNIHSGADLLDQVAEAYFKR
jgi:D-alanyl-D-alanine carboxypeptidase